MRILWLCNSIMPCAAEVLGVGTSKPESWITGVYEQIKDDENYELIYLFPCKDKQYNQKIGNATFISYTQKKPLKFEKKQITEFRKILSEQSPDVIHIFGTEYAHTYAMTKAAESLGMLGRVVINIQGLVSLFNKHYYAFLPEKCIHRCTLRDFVRHNNIYNQRKNFEKLGVYEEKSIELAGNVIGRTDWDFACAKRINPEVNYYALNETLRKPFYENRWDIEKIERHSIFVTQCHYPLKGMHLMLEAMVDILKQYPDAHLYTTGNSPLNLSFRKKLHQTYYRRYLGRLIKKYNLEKHITFLGFLNENQMCERYLKTNVFVSPSSIENSPNSVGEAMRLGVPTVTSDVGGVKTMLAHEKEGYIYQADAPYMLARCVMNIFENDSLALKFSENAIKKAAVTHSPKDNLKRQLEIYDIIANKD